MSEKAIKVLLVEDDTADAHLLREMLRLVQTHQFELTQVARLEEAHKHLGGGDPDVVLLDLRLPDASGLEAVREVRRAASSVPIVVLTGLRDEVLAMEALREGAQDYLLKDQIASSPLVRAIRYAIERQRVQATLQSLSLLDDLTGLRNRRGFFTLAEQHLKMAHRTGQPFLLAFIDLDGLKQINDTLGHPEGDLALLETASVLRDTFRQSDILARLGGDEFAALAIGASEEGAEILRKRFILPTAIYCRG